MQNDPIYVLLADDDENDRMFFKEALEEIKIKTVVKTVMDGIELLEHLKFDTILPSVLFLDLNMPRKGGMECLQELRSDDRFKDVVVAIYSTSASEEDIEETFVKGADVYIKKPNDFLSLKNILSKVITINWQYRTSGLDRDNFLLSL